MVGTGESETFLVLCRVGKVFQRAEKIAGPEQGGIDRDPGGDLALFGVRHGAGAGADFFGDVADGQVAPQPGRAQVRAQALDGLLDGVGRDGLGITPASLSGGESFFVSLKGADQHLSPGNAPKRWQKPDIRAGMWQSG